MDGLNPEAVKDAQAALRELMARSRFCAVALPVQHKKGRRKYDTGDFVVKLFEGGVLRMAKEAQAREVVDAINEALRELVRKLFQPRITTLSERVKRSISLESLRDYNAVLSELSAASRMQVRVQTSGDGLGCSIVSDPVEFTIRGEKAVTIAAQFVNDVNEALKPFKKMSEEQLRNALVEALDQVWRG